MSPFAADVLKILLDKVLLGILAALFGFYLNRLLEKRRAHDAYLQSLAAARADACRQMGRLLADEHFRIAKLHKMLHVIAEKTVAGKKLEEVDLQDGFEYIKHQDAFKAQVLALSIAVPPFVMSAVRSYLHETNKLWHLIRGEFSKATPIPTADSLSAVFARVMWACHLALEANPFREPSDDEQKEIEQFTAEFTYPASET